eukprot:TRINITY_DN73929_c0_g1_i1.p1 TRINITY_DN73929_c0_g1~~TRINITY_DN73929_c0_g1_i1.p1  ORF type:complete len:184 (+),score=32.36 TRINITY_DN73929_c0_g1_i1:28-579(+)
MTDIPQLSILDEQEQEQPVVCLPRSNSKHIDLSQFRLSPRERRASTIKYFNEQSVPAIIHALVSQLLIQQPEHPVQFLIQALRTYSAVTLGADSQSLRWDEDGGGDYNDLHEVIRAKFASTDDPARAYVNRYKIDWLFTDLLNQLNDQRPDDAHQFCLTLLRWRRRQYEEEVETLGVRRPDSP